MTSFYDQHMQYDHKDLYRNKDGLICVKYMYFQLLFSANTCTQLFVNKRTKWP